MSLIASANNLKDGDPASGDRLVIPAVYKETAAAPVRVVRAQARGSHASTGAHTQTVSKRSPVKAHTASASTVSAKRPVHPVAGTMAQLKDHK